MTTKTDTPTPAEKLLFDWYWNRLDPNSFKGKLAAAILHADTGNRRLLSKGFPDEVAAFNNYNHTADYWDSVNKRVGSFYGLN